MKHKVDQDLCIGCGTCIALAPKSYKWNDANKSDAINPPGDDDDTVRSACDACPVTAIFIEE